MSSTLSRVGKLLAMTSIVCGTTTVAAPADAEPVSNTHANEYRLESSKYTIKPGGVLTHKTVTAACGKDFHVEYDGGDWEGGPKPIIRYEERSSDNIYAYPNYLASGNVVPEKQADFKVTLENWGVVSHTIKFSWLCIPNPSM
ncbi:hypothetical protein K4749_38310 [Streptomyces sp. TRM72054]|uniref:hypothetical protein n=1 Tax=Streptomyces sp. TRM72054 TaxID=2870562 RepID=UPI001C8B958B|nr:hypothetical protein [Streptomyces sp. TRM72054]MBX9399269.1 hypothetical protein [Streptomyces sp. TRM72054]